MRRAFVIAVSFPLAVGLVSCGDDDDGSAAATRTDAEYCAELRTLPEGGGPTDEFFEKFPDPTLADWAEGLPDVIDTATEQRDALAEVPPSAGLADERQAVLDAFDDVIASFGVSLDAAKAGDQDTFDAEERRNQDENVPALMEAVQPLMRECGGTGE